MLLWVHKAESYGKPGGGLAAEKSRPLRDLINTKIQAFVKLSELAGFTRRRKLQ